MQSSEHEIGSWDSVLLENTSEDAFIGNIHQRYKRDQIYTYIGTYLVSVNPYKPLLLYTPDLIKTYSTRSFFQLPPHIYAVANSAYQWLQNYNEDQCIIMSGESGAGKTETSRMCIHFLTQVAENVKSKVPKLPRQRSSNSFANTKTISKSQPNSITSTPKHTMTTTLSTSSNSTIEKTGCLVIGSAGGSLPSTTACNNGSFRNKCSHEKTVEFDFSHHSSSENLAATQSSKCSKHPMKKPSSHPKPIGHSQSLTSCTKHNNIKFDLSSSSSSSLLLSGTTGSRKHNTICQHHTHLKQQNSSNSSNNDENNKLNEQPLSSSSSSSVSAYNKHISKRHQMLSSSSTMSPQSSASTAIKRSNPNLLNSSTNNKSTTNIIECNCNIITKLYNATRNPIISKKSKITVGGGGGGSPCLIKSQSLTKSSTLSLNNAGVDNLELLRIKEKISQVDVLLEALGNATTIKNTNSSRFGKFFDIEFDFKGDPIGGQVTHYMLEKSRITQTSCGERNFHIFYQLLSGADIQFLKTLKLQRNVDKYELLKHGQPTDDDKKNFLFTRNALDLLGFTQDEVLSMFKIIAVVIKLGNLVFLPSTNIDGTENCIISNEHEIHEISQLLNLDYDILINCLIRGDDNWTQLNTEAELDASAASRIKNILCRTLYGRLFTWAVNRINESIKIKSQYTRGRNLGILDFYGFEILGKNSFEQLAINYCNERIHQNFLQNVLKFQQDLYTREGLEWQRIDYFDNEAICELIDKSNYGILSLLEEPQVTSDEAFQTRIYQCCSGNPNFLRNENIPDLQCFQVRHYAGQVVYTVDNFIEKNLDVLPKSISLNLYQSKLNIVQTLFPEGNPKRTAKKPASVGSNLRRSLASLLTTLNNRRNYYVFCIKPNELKQQRFFELPLIQHQIRYMNLMPLVNLFRNGHYFHVTHVKFLNRYKILSPITWPHFKNGTLVEGIAIIIRSVRLPIAEFTIGSNHVFIRSPRTVFELENFRKMRLDYLATFIQKTFRCYSRRKLFLQMRRSQIVISSAWRTWRECRFGIPFTGRHHMWGLYRVAQEEYRITKYRKQVEWAVNVIQRAYIQWKKRQFFLTLPLRLPVNSMSPLYFEWPVGPRYLTETSQLLRNIFHRWRCYRYRKTFDQTSRNRMREKVTASIIFKDRKSSYIKSVSHPFLGDYVRLRQNVQWKKISVEHNDQYVVFADIINKITRSSGKFVPILLVLSTNSMLLLDQRTLQIKYRVPATEIYRLSLSPYLDDIAVFHVKADCAHSNHIPSSNSSSGCLFQSEFGKKKGDFVFQTGHVIEIVTKLFLVVQNATTKPPEVHISTEFEANFGQQTVLFSFKCGGLADQMSHTQPKVTRKPNRMEIII